MQNSNQPELNLKPFIVFYKSMKLGIARFHPVHLILTSLVLACTLFLPYLSHGIYTWLFPPLRASWIGSYFYIIWFGITSGTARFIYVFSLCYFSCLFIKGRRTLARFEDYELSFKKVGIKNYHGKTITVIDEYLDGKTLLGFKIRLHGNSLERIKNCQDELSSSLGRRIYKIECFKHPDYAIIDFRSCDLPDSFRFCTVMDGIKTPYSFIIGKTAGGILKANLADLPHLLIAGTTGFGKSNCFNQILASLMLSSNNCQYYLIDLKQGVEFIHFKGIKNVLIAENIEKASLFLEKAALEMEARLKWMRENGVKKVGPSSDKFSKIVVAIDECSLLFTPHSKESPYFDAVKKARFHLEYLSKLGRGAGIHLIAATQKVDRHSIPTQVQENFSARISFRANTIEAATRIIKGTSARSLSAIKGRGLWQFEYEAIQFQASLFTDADMKLVKRKIFQKQKPACLASEAIKENIKSKSLFDKEEGDDF